MTDTELNHIVEQIRHTQSSIYDDGYPQLSEPMLEALISRHIVGTDLHGLPLRTRSKVVKKLICESLGYPVPLTFRKTQPRFPAQDFDIYIQKSNNLQIWNEEIHHQRRYVLIRVSGNIISEVRVISGAVLAQWDTTGTLTQKYQASVSVPMTTIRLVSSVDTQPTASLVGETTDFYSPPDSIPTGGGILPIHEIFTRLCGLVGTDFVDSGYDQERNRGAILHRLACVHLGYESYRDHGQFPDIRHQLLEIKLQTSQTIDLGLVSPDSSLPLSLPVIGNTKLRHCDVRYAIALANTQAHRIYVTGLVVVTGADFYSIFRQFQGNLINKKLQIPIPLDFFRT